MKYINVNRETPNHKDLVITWNGFVLQPAIYFNNFSFKGFYKFTSFYQDESNQSNSKYHNFNHKEKHKINGVISWSLLEKPVDEFTTELKTQILLLPTDKGIASDIYILDGKLYYDESDFTDVNTKYQYMYLTIPYDRDNTFTHINDRDWYYHAGHPIHKDSTIGLLKKNGTSDLPYYDYAHKIIATTDPKLKLPNIPKAFIKEAFKHDIKEAFVLIEDEKIFVNKQNEVECSQ